MKVALYTLCYLDGEDLSGSRRLTRNLRYLEYYTPLKDALGFQDIWMADNASNPGNLVELMRKHSAIRMIQYGDHLPRTGDLGYPYCWRGLWEIKTLIRLGYQKIIFIDTDGFILSNRLANYTKNLSSGWWTLWTERHGFPSAEFQILCQDSFPLFLDYTKGGWKDKVGLTMEKDLPYSINREFTCDRYGESRDPQRPGMDFYGQAPTDIELVFGKYD